MNLKFSIVPDANRPIILYKQIRILFDTGATIPVWCLGAEEFCDTFPEADKKDYRCILSGFGRTENELKDFLKNPTPEKAKDFVVDVYRIPDFPLSSADQTITWENLQVAITEKESIGADLILPSTMFRGMEFKWDQKDVNKPYLEIISKSSTKYVYVRKRPDKLFGTELLNYIYAQDTTSTLKNDTDIKSGKGVNSMDLF